MADRKSLFWTSALAAIFMFVPALVQTGMAFWITFGYPPDHRPWWEYPIMAMLWMLPVTFVAGFGFITVKGL